MQQTGSDSRSFTDRRGSFASIRFTRCWGVGEPRPGGRRAGRRWHSWGCLAPACENLFLTTETAHILRDDETASLLLTVSYSRATKAPTPWHTRLHPDTSRSKISEQQCLAGPGSPHNDRSDGKPKFRRIPADSGGNPEFRRKSSGFRRKSEPGPPEIQQITI